MNLDKIRTNKPKNSDVFYYSLDPFFYKPMEADNITAKIVFLPGENSEDVQFVFSHPLENTKASIFGTIQKMENAAVENANGYLLISRFYINSHEVLDLLINIAPKLLVKIYILVGEQEKAFIKHRQGLFGALPRIKNLRSSKCFNSEEN